MAEAGAQQLERLPMGDAATPRHLGLGGSNVFDQLRTLDQGFVRLHRKQDGSASTVLSQDERTLARLHLFDTGGDVGAKLR